MFDLRSLIWGFGESCTIVQSKNSVPENVLPSVLFHWHCRDLQPFRSNLKGILFDPEVWGLEGSWVSRINPIGLFMICPWVPIGSPLTCGHIWPIFYRFELFSWLQKRFRPPAGPSDADRMTISALEAIDSSSGKHLIDYRSKPSLFLSNYWSSEHRIHT